LSSEIAYLLCFVVVAAAVACLSACIADMNNWMKVSCLCDLTSPKQVMWLGTGQDLHHKRDAGISHRNSCRFSAQPWCNHW